MIDKRLLFITLSNIGDLVLTTPALLALHAAYPDHRVDIVADARSSSLLKACPFLHTLYHRDKRLGIRGMLELIGQLRRVHYAAMVDLRTDFAPWLLRGTRRTARWRRGPHGPHAIEQHMAIVSQVLPEASTIPNPTIWIAESDTVFAHNLLADLRIKRWLALGPGANWLGKQWPREHFAALLVECKDAYDGVLILGGSGDQAAAEYLASRNVLPTVNMTGKSSLTQAVALLDHAVAFVGNDSGLGHLAAARGVPTLTLFGPGRPERYRPWGGRAKILLAPDKNLAHLSAIEVAAALKSLPSKT
ncbi:MAG: glycosyltransferase family 9 protein [Gammaproteobacteria bacterium]|nr:glycosyltransferase family 9 protein [Gammaproteobacteria bacterium]